MQASAEHQLRRSSAVDATGPADSAEVSAQRKLEALRSVHCYPVAAESVEVIETHFAWVFLVGEYAYKMKKAQAYPFLDLRSIEDRRRNCMQEVQLNRRLAPDVYLGTVPLVLGPQGKLAVGGEGTVVEWLIWMRRLPAQFMLDRAIADGTVTAAALVGIGATLANFYERQPRFFMPADRYLDRLMQRMDEEGAELRAPELQMDESRVNAALAAISSATTSLRAELGHRAMSGIVRDCHGDLRPEHICLQPPCVIDSLEFSRDLRILDPAEELAFLRLECQIVGAREVGDKVVSAYQEHSGDSFSGRLLDCYQARRALIRAKIVAWHVRDPEVATLAPWIEKAHAYVDLAERHASLACRS